MYNKSKLPELKLIYVYLKNINKHPFIPSLVSSSMIQRSRLIAIHQHSISKPFIPQFHPCFQSSKSCSFSGISTNFSRVFEFFQPSQSKSTPTFRNPSQLNLDVEIPIPMDTPEWLHPVQVFADCSRLLNEYFSSQNNPSIFPISKQNLFQLEVSKSKIPNSGNGIFTKRDFSRGQIVSFYPGVYYPPLPSYVINLPDGAFAIDLRPKDGNDDYDNAYQIHCSLGGFCEAKNGQTSNIALSHLINHPPMGILPNVVSFCFYWKDLCHWLEKDQNFNQSMLQRVKADLIPTINTIAEGEPWYLDPNTEEIVYLKKDSAPLIGMVFVANREIVAGEELFFDYKFKITNDLPSWYHRVTYEQIE